MTGKTSVTNSVVSREALAEHFERQIVSGEIPAATKLPSERQLAEQFGVSRPIVREALRILAERNLIDILPARGAYVRAADPAGAASRLENLYRMSSITPRHLTDSRHMLESTAAGIAATRITAPELERVHRAMMGCENATNILEQARQDFSFHHAVIRASANPVIEVMFVSISSLTFQLMLRSLSDRALVKESLPYHQAVFAALREHHPEAASAAMTEHLDIARQRYGDDFDASLEAVARREIALLLPGEVNMETLLLAESER